MILARDEKILGSGFEALSAAAAGFPENISLRDAALGDVDADGRMDLVMVGRCQQLGYEVHLKLVDEKITPQNRLICGRWTGESGGRAIAGGSSICAGYCAAIKAARGAVSCQRPPGGGAGV